MEVKIRLTPALTGIMDNRKADKLVAFFILSDEWIRYTLALDFPSEMYMLDNGDTIGTDGIEFQFKKYETGLLMRKDIVGVAKTSYTEFNPDEKEAKYTHMLLFESAKSQMGLTCTQEEKNRYYPYLEDYYKGGDMWKRLNNIKE